MKAKRGEYSNVTRRQYQNIYNTGYRAGARRIVIAWLGAECKECGEDNINKLEIAHIKPMNDSSHRDYTCWLDKDNVKLLCQQCNQREENVRRK